MNPPIGLDHRLLCEEEERQLARRAHAGDTEARNCLAEANLRLIWTLSGRFGHGERDELYGVGCAAMLEAIPKWDPDAAGATRLAGFLSTTCYRAMQKSLNGSEALVTLDLEGHGDEQGESKQRGRQFSTEEAREALLLGEGLDPAELRALRTWFADVFTIAGLSQLAVRAVVCRHGLRPGEAPMAFSEVAERLGIVKSRAHREYGRAITRIRAAMGAPAFD